MQKSAHSFPESIVVEFSVAWGRKYDTQEKVSLIGVEARLTKGHLDLVFFLGTG